MAEKRNRIGSAVLAAGLVCSGTASAAQSETPDRTVVRIAELTIDPASIDAYKKAVREEIEESIRVEPGVLAIYAVAEKGKPDTLRFFEMYTSDEAYRAHIESAHFKKYASVTKQMIRSKKLIEAVPIELGSKKS